MSRKPTGTLVRTKAGLWQAFITLADGTRKRIPPFPAGTTEEMAREKAAHYAERAKELGLMAPPKAKVAADDAATWVKAWHDDRVARGLTSARDS